MRECARQRSGQEFDPILITLVRPSYPVDLVERLGQVFRWWLLGGEDVLSDADLNGSVAACGGGELLDRPAGAVLDESCDCEGCEHGVEVGAVARVFEGVSARFSSGALT